MLKGKIPLIIAILLGVLSGVFHYYQLKMREAEVTKGWETQPIFVAKYDLQPGETLTNDSVVPGEIPSKFFYSGLLDPNSIVNAYGLELLSSVKKGKPIHQYQIRGFSFLKNLSKKIQINWRAVSIDVGERNAVGYWVKPNDRVDILGTFRDPNANEMVAITILQNVIVLATGSQRHPGLSRQLDQKYSTITVKVVPEEAEVLLLAQQMGNLSLSLRNPDDISLTEERTRTNIDTLLTGERLREIQKRRGPTKPKIIRGVTGSLKTGRD